MDGEISRDQTISEICDPSNIFPTQVRTSNVFPVQIRAFRLLNKDGGIEPLVTLTFMIAAQCQW